MPLWPTEKEVDLVRSSFARLVPCADVIIDRFYGKVFDAAPEARNLFRNDMRVQRNKVLELLSYIVYNLEKRSQVEAQLQELGRRHRQYGVVDVHFVVVRAALIETFAESSEVAFTPAELAAWDKLFRFMAAGMGVRLAKAA